MKSIAAILGRPRSAHPVQETKRQFIETPSKPRAARRRQVAKAVSECLAGLPRHVSLLNTLLTSPPIDLTRVSQIISADPQFCGLLLGLASTELFNARSCGVTVPQAVVLFGSERLRALALASAFFKCSGRYLAHDERNALWQHGFLTAMLSERTARQMAYPESGQAYLAGLLHDIGRLPLLIVARDEEAAGFTQPANWQDSPSAEQDYFGVDHGEVGRSIAAAWNLAPSLIDAVEHHHTPSQATHDSYLAEIVAAGDRYSNFLLPVTPKRFAETPSPRARAIEALLGLCVPRLCEDEEIGSASFLTQGSFDNEEISQSVH